MTDPSNVPPASPAPQTHDFEAVGRRISRWTLNGLATGLVIVLGLAGGRQILQWWREGAPAADTLPQPTVPPVSRIDFGAAGFVSQPHSGDQRSALKQLRALCARLGHSASAPSLAPTSAEQRLLADLSNRTPAEVSEGCRLDELAGAALLVAATREFPTQAPARRVVALGMALPLADNAWTLYVFPPPGQTAAGPDSPLKLPPGSQTILALHPENGPTTVAFRGPGEVSDWRAFFSEQAKTAEWTQSGDWQPSPTGEHALFSISTPVRLRLELSIGTDGPGILRGLAVLTPEQ